MGYWHVVIPTAATNLFSDPSLEFGTLATYWTSNVGGGTGTTALSTAQACFGKTSCLLTPGNNGAEIYQTITTAAASYTLSCYAKRSDSGVVTSTVFQGAIDNAPVDWDSITLVGNGWYRCVKTASETAAGHITGVYTPAAGAIACYVDGLQFELGTVTTYIDGTQPGCSWNGAAHASTSTRSAQSRAGGTVVDLETYGAYTMRMGGWGTLPIGLNVSEQAFRAGALLQSIKQKTRTMTITFDVEGTSLANYHSKRKDLIDAFKPDLVADVDNKPEPIRLQYTGTGATVEIAVDYAGGLEGDLGEGFREAIPVRFQASDDPFWHEIPETAAILTEQLSVSNADEVIAKINGTWTSISTDFASKINAMAVHPDGSIYIGGDFTNVGDANGDYIVKYNPATATLSSLSTGLNGIVWAIAIAPDGTVYIGGEFTDAGDANGDYIVKWTGSAWASLSTGLPAAVGDIVFGQDGSAYIVGSFTNVTDANGDYITKWNGTAFSSLGTGLQAAGYCLATAKDGGIIVGGSFTSAGGVSGTGYIAKWNGTTWVSLGGGANNYVQALAIMPNGEIVAGGSFTAIGGLSISNLAKWNGTVWSGLGSGVNSTVFSLGVTTSGLLIAGGFFTSAGGLTLADRIAVWNGTSWAHLDIDLPGSPNVYAIASSGTSLYLGYDTTGTATASKLNTVTNSGTAKTYPKLTVKRSGGTIARLEWLKNETTGATLWFNYSLLDGETLTIDFQAKTIISDFFGNVIGRALLPNSDFGAWCLLPGSNSVSVYVYETGTPTVTSTLLWRNCHHSVDGSAA